MHLSCDIDSAPPPEPPPPIPKIATERAEIMEAS